MLKRYIVTYDICDSKRLRMVYRAMRGYGEHLQYSVFRCDLTPVRRLELEGDLGAIINHKEDQVLLIDLGPARGKSELRIQSLGRPYEPAERTAMVF